jgi:hypothetical protein
VHVRIHSKNFLRNLTAAEQALNLTVTEQALMLAEEVVGNFEYVECACTVINAETNDPKFAWSHRTTCVEPQNLQLTSKTSLSCRLLTANDSLASFFTVARNEKGHNRPEVILVLICGRRSFYSLGLSNGSDT